MLVKISTADQTQTELFLRQKLKYRMKFNHFSSFLEVEFSYLNKSQTTYLQKLFGREQVNLNRIVRVREKWYSLEDDLSDFYTGLDLQVISISL